MKNNGFTLVEILAVIVILAVLALIATPVVLSLIDDAKESAMLRSAEMYLSGVENAVMRENMNSGGNFRPNECTISNGNMTCGSTNVEVEVDGEVPSTGTIIFENGKITEVTLKYESGTIIKDSSGSLVYEGSETSKTFEDICKYQNNGVAEKTAGAKYSCEVKPGTSYNFYVLKTPAEGDTTINLIMDQNICEDGTLATTENTCLVAWISELNYGCGNDEDWDFCATNEKGPITSMTYLHNATKDWTNIEPVNYTYNDRTVQGNADGEGYTSFVSSNGVAKIKSLTGDEVTIGSEQVPLRARMPIYASDASITEVANSNGSNNYLYDNLDPAEWHGTGTPPPLNDIRGIIGYWTLSSSSITSFYAWRVYRTGIITGYDSTMDHVSMLNYGVRPVITLKI